MTCRVYSGLAQAKRTFAGRERLLIGRDPLWLLGLRPLLGQRM